MLIYLTKLDLKIQLLINAKLNKLNTQYTIKQGIINQISKQ